MGRRSLCTVILEDGTLISLKQYFKEEEDKYFCVYKKLAKKPVSERTITEVEAKELAKGYKPRNTASGISYYVKTDTGNVSLREYLRGKKVLYRYGRIHHYMQENKINEISEEMVSSLFPATESLITDIDRTKFYVKLPSGKLVALSAFISNKFFGEGLTKEDQCKYQGVKTRLVDQELYTFDEGLSVIVADPKVVLKLIQDYEREKYERIYCVRLGDGSLRSLRQYCQDRKTYITARNNMARNGYKLTDEITLSRLVTEKSRFDVVVISSRTNKQVRLGEFDLTDEEYDFVYYVVARQGVGQITYNELKTYLEYYREDSKKRVR